MATDKKQVPAKGKPSPSTKTASSGSGLEQIVLRNHFYRDNYRRLMLLCLGLMGLAVTLAYWVLYERTHKPLPEYFATTYDGKLIALAPLSQPYLSNNALLQWATEAAHQAYTFNFVNYRRALQDTRLHFTKQGYQYFLKALQDSGNLDAVVNRKLVVSATPTSAPVMLRQGVVQNADVPGGVYSWTVEMHMNLDYSSSTEQFTQKIILIMIITRTSILDSPDGVGIASFVVREDR